MSNADLWAMRGKFLFSLLTERTTPDGRVLLEINEQSIGPGIWIKPDATEREWLSAVDCAMPPSSMERAFDYELLTTKEDHE